MIEVKKFFGFAFGGNNDFGEEIALKESKLIDFSSKPTGVGFAIRNNQEADLSNQSSMVALVTVSADIDLTVEFKTEKSNGTPEVSKRICLKKGENNVTALIPSDLSSPLKEIVFFFERHEREYDVEIKFNYVSFLR